VIGERSVGIRPILAHPATRLWKHPSHEGEAINHSLGERLRYAFDNIMARGTVALVSGLFLASALLIVGVALLVTVLGGLDDEATAGVDFIQLSWMTLLRTLDPGTMADDAGPVVFVLGMFSATIGGVLFVAILIGLVTSGIEGRLTELRRGRSRVIERDHTIILGWSAQAPTLIEELIEANASRSRAAIVVLAERDKVEMEDELRERIPRRRSTRIVCRSGSPIDSADIDICSPQAARSIVVLGHNGPDADAEVIKTMLAISNSPTRRAEPYRLVAEIQDPRNAEVARLAARGEARIVVVGDLIGRIAAQACRQPGLSVVYEELLDFAGDEMYFSEHLGLAGQTFGDALLAFADSALLGLVQEGGSPQLNPPMETRIGERDRLIVLARDDSTIHLGQRPPGTPVEERIGPPRRTPPHAERTLVLGWNRRAPAILQQLDSYVDDGSEVLVASSSETHRAPAEAAGARSRSTRLEFRHADTTSRAALEELLEPEWDRVVILPYAEGLAPQQADARTLVTLLHVRDINGRAGRRLPIVTEMLDLRNRELAQVTRADDFIVSEKLVSQMLAQLSESPELEPVFADLFDVEGSEIYLRPASSYLTFEADGSAEPIDFYTVVESARRQGEVAIGYRVIAWADDPARNYGVVLNPPKADQVALESDDLVIVLAED